VFTGLLPLHRPPEESELWCLASKYGAHCAQDIELGVTTHLIAAKFTDKVEVALRVQGIFVVHVNWLWSSTRRWSRLNEFDFPLEKIPVLPEGSIPPTILNNESSEEDEEEKEDIQESYKDEDMQESYEDEDEIAKMIEEALLAQMQ